jgi:hypothetical protein
VITAIPTILLEEERSREAEAEVLRALQSHQEDRRGGIRARATER